MLSLGADEILPRKRLHDLERVSLFQTDLGANGSHEVCRHQQLPRKVHVTRINGVFRERQPIIRGSFSSRGLFTMAYVNRLEAYYYITAI